MVKVHHVRVHRSDENLAREDQLAWKIAEVAADPVAGRAPRSPRWSSTASSTTPAVAVAAINRAPGRRARAPRRWRIRATAGATVFGLPQRPPLSPEWAAWANGVAVRELDFHDTFLAADYSHPGDNIPPILAVAQQTGASRRAICCAASPPATRSRSTWCAHLPARAQDRPHRPSRPVGRGRHRHAARPRRRDDLPGGAAGAARHLHHAPVAQGRDFELEGLRARPSPASWPSRRSTARMRGEGAPSPIYEGEDGVIAWLLDGPGRRATTCRCPEPGEPKRAHPRLLHQGAFGRVPAPGADRSRASACASTRARDLGGRSTAIVIHTSHHTHYVIGTGANDPQKMDPKASRETLDHSIMYIFAVALEDGAWHHVALLRARARRAAGHGRLWQQDLDGRGRGVDPPLPLDPTRPSRPSAAASRSRSKDGTDDRGRDRRRQRAPARRAPVRAARTTSASSSTPGRGHRQPRREQRAFLDAGAAPARAAPGRESARLNVVARRGRGFATRRATRRRESSDAVREEDRAAEKRAALRASARLGQAAALPRRVLAAGRAC